MKNGGIIKQENNVADNSTSDKIKAKLKQAAKGFGQEIISLNT